MNAIDRFFDLVDRGVDRADHLLSFGKKPVGKARTHKARGAEAVVAEVVPNSSNPKPLGARGTLGTGNGLVRRSRFYIVEAVVSGTTQFVVTDGGKARTVCPTRPFAEQLLIALEKAP